VEGWTLACRAAALLALDSAGLGGVLLRAPPGEARAAWLALAKRLALEAGGPVVQVPASVTAEQLLGGLDLERTLALGRPVAQQGALARVDGGLLLLAMAERAPAGTAALIAAALDSREAGGERDGVSGPAPARFGLVALDESLDDEDRPQAVLRERMAMEIDLSACGHRDIGGTPAFDLPDARRRLPSVVVPDGAVESLCAAAFGLGINSGRAPLLALRTARASAALAGRTIVSEEDVLLAARLVLAHRARHLPQGEQEAPAPEDAPPPDETPTDEVRPLEDKVLEAATAAIPAGLLKMLQEQAQALHSRESGKAGESRAKALRGRPIGSRRGDLRSRARLDLLDTLRAAAPWQRLRRGPDGEERLRVRREDVRLRRYRDRQASTTIFVVDASGSTAMDRLGEAKGAVEMLLADCYVRRDEVALIAFRGAGADLLLPATRSLTRAKRSLAALPGGGGTPLASGLAAAESLAEEVRRKGRTPTLVVITDGRANVGRNGIGGREQAHADAELAARAIGDRKLKAILIDNSPRPEAKARGIAERMGALYLPLPRMDAAILTDAVRSHAGAARPGARA
jgi:magnesium chelatase subunit D